MSRATANWFVVTAFMRWFRKHPLNRVITNMNHLPNESAHCELAASAASHCDKSLKLSANV